MYNVNMSFKNNAVRFLQHRY